MSRPTTVRAARSPLTAYLVQGKKRPAQVVAAFPTAVYLDVGDTVLPLVTSDGLHLPTAVRLPTPSERLDWGVRGGDTGITVGDGRIRLGDLVVKTVRDWRPAQVSQLVDAPEQLPVGLEDPVSIVGALLGSGPGLTPSGDGVLCGLLLAGRAVRADGAWWVGLRSAATVLPAGRTTGISASLIRAALDGYALPPVVDLVHQVASMLGLQRRAGRQPDPDLTELLADARAVQEALIARVMAIGHTTGAALAYGVLAALDPVRAAALLRQNDLGLPGRVPPLRAPAPAPARPVVRRYRDARRA